MVLGVGGSNLAYGHETVGLRRPLRALMRQVQRLFQTLNRRRPGTAMPSLSTAGIGGKALYALPP
eukprot:3940876-Rhodomonas_salina.8